MNLSFTLDSLFACPFGKLTLLSNEVNVEPACPKLSIVHRPATASSVRLVVLASVILLFFLRVTSQGAASSKQGRVEEGCTLRREEELVAPCGSACMLHVHVPCILPDPRFELYRQGMGVGLGRGSDVRRLRLVGPPLPPWFRSSSRRPFPSGSRILLN